MTNHAPETPSAARGLFARLARLLASPWCALAAVLFGLLLTWPVAYNGLDTDDYYHRAVLTGAPRFKEKLRGPQAMFRFVPGQAEHARGAMDVGLMPWWTDPEIKAEFFQLLTVQTHVLDYWLWPERPDLMHVHSLCWFALLILLVARFYRRILGPTWMAGLAVLLFAIDDAHGTAVGWVCNRNVLIAASFGVACVIVHDAWRRDGRRWAFGVALLLWGCSLCSKEAGIATSAYLFAYALWIDESTIWRRFLTLVPYGLILIVWRTVRDSLGYGVENLGFYVDPITNPSRFAQALLERYPIFLLGQWAVPSDFSVLFLRLLASPLWWIAVGYVCFLGLLFWPVLRRDRVARFFATGMLLSVIPICATIPTDRLLMFVGLGAMGLLVRFWYMAFSADAPRPTTGVWRFVAVPVAVLFVLLHVVIAPCLLTLRATAPTGPRPLIERLYIRVPFDETIAQQDLVVVNAPSVMHASYCLLLYEHEGLPSPRAVRTLAPGFSPVTVRRTDEHTLEISPHGGYLRFFFDRLFRNEENPLALGDEVRIARMTATVLSLTCDGRPANVAFRFDSPLEDDSLRWLRWRQGDFVPWTPPAVGKQITLDPEWGSLADVLYGRFSPDDNPVGR